jgi:peptidoglycan/LPS O-acetylase OafA/YrhL
LRKPTLMQQPSPIEDRVPPSRGTADTTTRDEAGTPPGDRRFRPDVQGLRAVAVALVVLYHAGIPHVTGGFIGVDVFFVISGFVITGLLLREQQFSDAISILHFYARRCRRIIPAATLVILTTVVVAYIVLGAVAGNSTADDGRWAAVFLSNFHFESLGTNYLTAVRPPSPLQNFWSLSVEEQFYLIYPTLFLLVSKVRTRMSLRSRLTLTLAVVVASSFIWSVTDTATHPTASYFSPFTRAWELAIGALIALAAPSLRRVPEWWSAALTWVGLGAIVAAAVSITSGTAYPGSVVALPVIGAALVLGGGTAIPRRGAESLLALRPFQWLGARSYSLYLWHWPILVLAAERVGKVTLPVGENVVLMGFAVLISMVSYRFVENPVRHARIPAKASVLAGVSVIVATVVVLTLAIHLETASITSSVIPAANESEVISEVAAAPSITKVPDDLNPPLTDGGLIGAPGDVRYRCAGSSGVPSAPPAGAATEPICTLGDPTGTKLMVVYGDSHALMWLPALDYIAKQAHWRLVILTHYSCPAEPVEVTDPAGFGPVGAPYVVCNHWHSWAVREINDMRPDMVIVAQENLYQTPTTATSSGWFFTSAVWERGLRSLLGSLALPADHEVFLGNIPVPPSLPLNCLSLHSDDVGACSAPVERAAAPRDQVERTAVVQAGARYIDTTPWFCSHLCTPIVGKYAVYLDQLHMTGVYAEYLEKVLGQSLGLLKSS